MMINIFPLWIRNTVRAFPKYNDIQYIFFIALSFVDAIASVENAIRLSEKERIDT